MAKKKRIFLGELLIEQGLITKDQLNHALEEQKLSREMLGMILIRLGYVSKESLLMPVLAVQMNVPLVRLSETEISPEIIEKLPAKIVSHYKVIPVEFKDDVLSVAMSNPLDIQVLDDVEMIVKTKIQPVLASEDDVDDAIRKYYGVGADTIEDMMSTSGLEKKEDAVVESIDESDSDASISKFLNQILLEAFRDRTTDIHIEPQEDGLSIRYRVDGILYDAQVPSNIKYFQDALNSRIKIMANLNIAEKRLPQDGRFKVRVGGDDLDLRVSFLPTPFGQSVVIRILSSLKLLDLEYLGLMDDDLKQLDTLIRKPHGVIFLTGPTGSGKTTTLYSCLSRVNDSEKKIITVEDPVEYQLKGITQVNINAPIGLTFAAGLRSILRHDPDVIMVGEVRDVETAEIAIQSALTGHLVFSTLHTNDAAGGISRLQDMGIEPFLISSAVECLIAQRLVRKICPECKKALKVTAEIEKDFGLTPGDSKDVTIYEGKGCDACRNTGYKGRQAIYEFLFLNEEIRKMIIENASAGQIKEKAVSMGMKTLREYGWKKVVEGITTPSEVLRVSHEDAA